MGQRRWVIASCIRNSRTKVVALGPMPLTKHTTRKSAYVELKRLSGIHPQKESYSITVQDNANIAHVVKHWFECRFGANNANYGEDSAPIQPTVKQQETHMSISVTKPTFINGLAADSFSIDSLIDVIGSSQRRVAELQGLGFESKTVAALIAKEEKGIASAIAVLDARKVD